MICSSSLVGCWGKTEWEPLRDYYVEQIPFPERGQLDILFVIDNSTSMANKQELLQKAVPRMVEQLVNPACLHPVTGERTLNQNGCPEGTAPEFTPLKDIHIGLISSSLGGHGQNLCESVEGQENDHARLIPTMRSGITNPGNLGFLKWSSGQPTGEPPPNVLVDTFVDVLSEQVGAVGERGCGFEAPLEAWHRFLVDPEPPREIVVGIDGRSKSEGVDELVLAQRRAFLRPQSVVAIVILSDENDCSIMDGGTVYPYAEYAHLLPNPFKQMPVATSICATEPNHKCCFSCMSSSEAPDGCSTDECTKRPTLEPENDRLNVRCFDNQRRFGIDFLYPTARYVKALSKHRLVNARDGKKYNNPLLNSTRSDQFGTVRDPNLVFMAAIVGVPWQDIATPASLETDARTLAYLSAAELSEENVDVDGRLVNRWDLILGNTNDGRPPLDPFMIESISPRSAGAANPIVPDQKIGDAGSLQLVNSINGHELKNNVPDPIDNIPANDDLQYSCIFALEEPKTCSVDDWFCHCVNEPFKNSPVCQAPGQVGEASTTQYFGHAFPPSRILEVLHDIGDKAILASICPKNPTGDSSDSDFGFNPALKALVDPVQNSYRGACFEPTLPLDEAGHMRCSIVEARAAEYGESLDCDAEGRSAADDEVATQLRASLKRLGICGENHVSCDTYQVCGLRELTGEADAVCQTDPGDAYEFENEGYCYIDEGKPGALNVDLVVNHCRSDRRRMVRFSGEKTPTKGAAAFVVCLDEDAGGF
jgi:hypothetical protein